VQLQPDSGRKYGLGGRDGNIGYQAVGIAPQRPNWSGLVPVPGDGRYEWDGFLPIKALPHVLNPEKGFYNTSNEYQIPRGWPYKDALHYVWADPYRAQSVAEFLSSGRRFSVADMVQLQNNDLSIPARSLVPLLRDIEMPRFAGAAGRRSRVAPLELRARQGFGGSRNLRNVAAPADGQCQRELMVPKSVQGLHRLCRRCPGS
jgi:hypothetical protein